MSNDSVQGCSDIGQRCLVHQEEGVFAQLVSRWPTTEGVCEGELAQSIVDVSSDVIINALEGQLEVLLIQAGVADADTRSSVKNSVFTKRQTRGWPIFEKIDVPSQMFIKHITNSLTTRSQPNTCLHAKTMASWTCLVRPDQSRFRPVVWSELRFSPTDQGGKWVQLGEANESDSSALAFELLREKIASGVKIPICVDGDEIRQWEESYRDHGDTHRVLRAQVLEPNEVSQFFKEQDSLRTGRTGKLDK